MKLRSLVREDDSYEREKKVGVLILRALRKCGLEPSEYDGHIGGVKDKGDAWSSYILYSDDDGEATVKLDEANLSNLVKLQESGLIDGDCEIGASSDLTVRLIFKVHPSLRDGEATIN